MNLSDITVMILTKNEEANLRTTLEGVRWADQVLIIDSRSTDQTIEIAKSFSNVRIVYRRFDCHANQCNFGLTQVETPWVLSLDADYRCNAPLKDEIASSSFDVAGYRASFLYGVFGKPLRATLYPPRIVLYRRDLARYIQDGHAHRVVIDGEISKLETPILHDDWKPLRTWFSAQARYASQEADKLLAGDDTDLGWKDRLRSWILPVPLLTPIYCLFVQGLVLNGWRGFYYTLQRTFAELTLSLTLVDRSLRASSPHNLPESD